MKTVIIDKSEQETWRDGTPMVCSICQKPILRAQPRYATISHSPKKRDAYHFACDSKSSVVVI